MQDYQYLDPDGRYTDFRTGVLKNKAGIHDADALTNAESVAVIKRGNKLKLNPIKASDADALFEIHLYLFQDIYDWAGKRRVVEISKGGKQFLPTSRFDAAFEFINGLVSDYLKVAVENRGEIAARLAGILDAVNFAHFFREGNGRAQREFIRSLALQKGYALNLSQLDDASVYDRYMSGTTNGDKNALADLILELLRVNI